MLILRPLFSEIPNLGGIFQKITLTAFNEVYALSQEKNVTLRMASLHGCDQEDHHSRQAPWRPDLHGVIRYS